MNQSQEVAIILCLTIGIVIIINVGILILFRRDPGARVRPYKALGKALKTARAPWENEDKQLKELSNIIESIKSESEQNENH